MEKKLYSIGEISKISGLSHKALRHYDEHEVLKPDYVNPNNGYRYYSEYQILKLQNIVSLKNSGFTLEEIKRKFDEKNNRDMKNFLKQYKNKIIEMDNKILELKENKKKLQLIVDEFSYNEVDKIILKNFAIRHSYNLDEIGNSKLNISFIDIYNIIESSVNCGNAYLGKSMCLKELKETPNEKSSFLLFKEKEFLEKVDTIPMGEYITIRYRGSNRKKALEKIIEYIDENNISVLGIVYEIEIINSFLTQNKHEYITEIQIPIDKRESDKEKMMTNGKFQGTGKGYGGDLITEVTIEDNKIINLEIVSHNETKFISDPAFENIPNLIVKTNSILVPNVSGCSMSSRGIRESVKNALINAGANSEKLEIQMLEAENLEKIGNGKTKTILKPIEKFDVVIAGAGGAGLSAAIAASSNGLKVVVLEKMSSIGGNTLISMGGINIPENDTQIEKGIKDSKELYRNDIYIGGDKESSKEMLDIFVEEALPAYRWLKDYVKVSFKDELIHFGGHSVPRAAVFSGKYGIELIGKLRAKALLQGVEIRTGVTCESLLTDENNKVNGVIAKVENTNVKFMASKGVILATGGFSGNIELRKKYNSKLDERYKTTNMSGITGDGHLMSEALDAKFIQMDYIQTFPISNPETGELSHVGGSRFDGAILVNKEGNRFVEELERRDVVSEGILEQTNGIGYLVWGQEIENITNYVSKNTQEVERLEKSKLFRKCDTLEECANFFNINVKDFMKTIERYNGFVSNKKDEDFNRRGTLVSIKEGPFYIQGVAPAVHHTMGGLKVNSENQVERKDGSLIDGLYAAGEIVGGLHGTNRLGGNAITEIIVFGKRAGENISK